jgi:ribosomal protein L18E
VYSKIALVKTKAVPILQKNYRQANNDEKKNHWYEIEENLEEPGRTRK